jgi:hypothetical protein
VASVIVVYGEDDDDEEDVGVMCGDAYLEEVEVEYEGPYDGEDELVPATYERNEALENGRS